MKDNKNFIIYFIFGLLFIFFGIVIYNTLYLKKDNDSDMLISYLDKVEKINIEGLKNPVLFYSKEDKSLVTINIVFRAEAGLYMDEYPGIKDLFASLIEEHAGGMEFRNYQALLENYSIDLRVSSENDYFMIEISSLSYYFPTMIKVLDLILNSSDYSEEALNITKNKVLTYYNVSQSNVRYLMRKAIDQEIFAGNKYLSDLKYIQPNTINDVNLNILRNFQSRIFNKDVMSISISGNIKGSDINKRLTPVIKKMQGKPIKSLPQVKLNIKSKHIRIPVDNLQQTDIYMIINAPSIDQMDYNYLSIFNTYFGRMTESFLYNKVRAEQGLVYTISSNLYANKHYSYWLFYLGTSPDKTVSAIDLTSDLITNMSNYDYKDVLIAKNWSFNNTIRVFEKNSSIALFLNNILLDYNSLDNFILRRQNLITMSQKDIDLAIDKIDVNNMLIFELVDKN